MMRGGQCGWMHTTGGAGWRTCRGLLPRGENTANSKENGSNEVVVVIVVWRIVRIEQIVCGCCHRQ